MPDLGRPTHFAENAVDELGFAIYATGTTLCPQWNFSMRMIIAAALLLLPAPGFAAPRADSKAADPNKKICKVDPEDIDSRIRKRICKTRAEWERNGDAKGSSRQGK
jgi:hypothetical protein